MKTLFFLCLLLTTSLSAGILQLDQYPEDRFYTSADRGMSPYRASSIYKTGTFSLTFDDGPHPTHTAQILDILKRHNIKATFFVLTTHLNESYVPLIKRMLDEGHIVGNHGPNHDRAADLTKDQFKAQVKTSFLTLAKYFKLAGHPFKEHYFRFPYGDYGTRKDYHHINALKEVSQELMGDNCINMVFWDVDTADWVPGMTPQEVSSNIIAHNEGGTFVDFKLVNGKYVKYPYQLKNPPAGGVVLQHDVQAPSVQATDLFLTYAAERGLKILRLDEIEEFKITKNCSL
jgi:peptidoglycan/xylan/chitin deacetylase (PgdA/CDA1 family)